MMKTCSACGAEVGLGPCGACQMEALVAEQYPLAAPDTFEADRLKLCADLIAEADAREGLPVANTLTEAEACITMLAHDLSTSRAVLDEWKGFVDNAGLETNRHLRERYDRTCAALGKTKPVINPSNPSASSDNDYDDARIHAMALTLRGWLPGDLLLATVERALREALKVTSEVPK